MKVLTKINDLKKALNNESNKTIGFVPTMGYLHKGHLSLIKESLKENDITVVSIFVNPTQFSPNEDFTKYPRDITRDESLLNEIGTDYLFYPSIDEIYDKNHKTYILVEELSNKLCGKSRPTHFRGVTTIVIKLFNIVKPNNAYFGGKDAQQAIIIKRMTADLNLDVKIRTMPIVRDTDGLALSSRNVYLSPEERISAIKLNLSLTKARSMINKNILDTEEIKKSIKDVLSNDKHIKIDYIEIVDLTNLEPLKVINLNNTLVAIAAWVGNTRLIDNFVLGEI